MPAWYAAVCLCTVPLSTQIAPKLHRLWAQLSGRRRTMRRGGWLQGRNLFDFAISSSLIEPLEDCAAWVGAYVSAANLVYFDVGKRDTSYSLNASARALDNWMSGRILRVSLYVSENICSAMDRAVATLTIADYLAGGDWLDVFVPETSVAMIGFNCPDLRSRGKGMTVDIDLARDSRRVTLRAHEVRYFPGLPNDLCLVLVVVTLGSVLHFALKAIWMVMLIMDIVYFAERAGLFWFMLKRAVCSCERGTMYYERPWKCIVETPYC